MPSIVSLTRYIGELGLSLELEAEVVGTSLMYLQVAVKELSLTQLGSDSVALATAAVMLAAKTKETNVKQTEIVEVGVKLASLGEKTGTLSIEKFAERKKILKDKAGFFETLIIRLVPLDVKLGFFYLTGICTDAKILRVAQKLLLDFYRSGAVLNVAPEVLAKAALRLAEVVLLESPQTQLKTEFPFIEELLEDVYT